MLIRDRVHSGLCPFGIVSIRDGVHSGWYPFGMVSIRDCVHSGLCPFGIASIRDRVQDPKFSQRTANAFFILALELNKINLETQRVLCLKHLQNVHWNALVLYNDEAHFYLCGTVNNQNF